MQWILLTFDIFFFWHRFRVQWNRLTMYWPDRSQGSAVSATSFEMPSSARERCFHCNDHYHHYYYSFELLQIPESIIILMITLFPIIIIITLKDLWVPESLLHLLLISPLISHSQNNLGSKQREGKILFDQSQRILYRNQKGTERTKTKPIVKEWMGQERLNWRIGVENEHRSEQ